MSENFRSLGFVGFGAMPRRMALRLREASYSVVAFDPAHPSGDVDGFEMMPSPEALAQEVDVVLLCVPNGSALHQSTQGPAGALDGMRAGQLMLNFSTVSPDASQALEAAAEERGVRYAETPMSGSTPEAESGQLVILAGGAKANVDAAGEILDVVAHRTLHVGAVGDGLATKLVINGVMALGTAALAEGLCYGERAGLDRNLLIDALSSVILVSEHHKRKLAMARVNDYAPQFSTMLMSKDMGLLLADASKYGAPMPSMEAAAQLFAFAAQSHPREDYSAVIAALEAVVSALPIPSRSPARNVGWHRGSVPVDG